MIFMLCYLSNCSYVHLSKRHFLLCFKMKRLFLFPYLVEYISPKRCRIFFFFFVHFLYSGETCSLKKNHFSVLLCTFVRFSSSTLLLKLRVYRLSEDRDCDERGWSEGRKEGDLQRLPHSCAGKITSAHRCWTTSRSSSFSGMSMLLSHCSFSSIHSSQALASLSIL